MKYLLTITFIFCFSLALFSEDNPTIKPDLTMYGFLKIGKNKKEVKWGHDITLTPEDASSFYGGKPVFDISYAFREVNGVAAPGPFKNRIFFTPYMLGEQANLSLEPNEIKQIQDKLALSPKDGKLHFKIDAENKVNEEREDNNWKYWVNLKFKGFEPDLGLYGFIKIGKNKREVRWGDTITLTKSDMALINEHGTAFDVYYAYREFNGIGVSTPFLNEFYYKGSIAKVDYCTPLNPDSIKEVQTRVFLKGGDGKLELKIDVENSIIESKESNNDGHVDIKLQGPF